MDERIRTARAAMVAKFPYFAPMAYTLTLVETRLVPTMAVDRHARLYYNPDFLATVDDRQLVGLMWHEVNHLVRDHPGRGKPFHDIDPKRTMVAADLEVNDDAEEAGVTLPEGGVYPETFRLPRGKTLEEYFALLEGKKLPDFPHGSNTGGEAPWELPPDHPDYPGTPEAALEVTRRQVAEEAQRAAEGKGRGTVPSGIRRWAEAYLNPKVDWRNLLRHAIRRAYADLSKKSRPTYARPHRRNHAYRPFVLPGTYGLRPKVAVVIDTSGSVDRELLNQALSEVKGVLRVTRKVQVYTVDAEVHTAQTVFRPEDITLLGGGGTDMGQGIHRAVQDGHTLVIVLTDGETPWPETPPPARVIIALLRDQPSWPTPWWATTVEVG